MMTTTFGAVSEIDGLSKAKYLTELVVVLTVSRV
jgi:hypothetical protein